MILYNTQILIYTFNRPGHQNTRTTSGFTPATLFSSMFTFQRYIGRARHHKTAVFPYNISDVITSSITDHETLIHLLNADNHMNLSQHI